METQLEVLGAIDELSIPSVPVGAIKGLSDEDRIEMAYNSERQFTSPVVIRGTTRQLTPSNSVVSFINPDAEVLGSVIEACRNVEDTFQFVTIQSLSQLSITMVFADYIILTATIEGEDVNFALPTPANEEVPSKEAFHNLSTLLKIPYSFSKRNPAHLNDENFKYWKDTIGEDKERPIGIDILFQKELTIVEGVEAHVAVNIYKANSTRKLKGKSSVVQISTMEQKIPLFSRILENVVSQMEGIPNLTPMMESYSLAYNGLNKGQFYARLTFDGPESKISMNGEEFTLYLAITSDFTGRKKGFGSVNFQMGYFRMMCSNGVVIGMSPEQSQEMIEDMTTSVEGDENLVGPGIDSVIRNIANGAGLNTSVVNANKNPEVLGLEKYFQVLTASSSNMSENMEALDVQFEDITAEEFMGVSNDLAKQTGVSNRVVRYLNTEYLVDQIDGQEKKLGSPLEVLNFLTFVGRSFDTETQVSVEKNAFEFASRLKSSLIDKIEHRKDIVSREMRRISPDLLN